MSKPQNNTPAPAPVNEEPDEREFTEGRYAEVRDFSPRALTPLRKALWFIGGPVAVILLILIVVYLW